jgi:dienelactone hydrolase
MKIAPAALIAVIAALALVAGAAAAPATAAIHTETVTYKQGDTTLKGYLAYDDTLAGKRPGVLVVHEWWGLNDYARRRAEALAAEGYVAFAADMYGAGRTTTHPDEAGQWSQAVQQNQEAGMHRFMAAYELLAHNPRVDAERIAAIGYCFGGGVVLAMAGAGVDLDGVVSFHGALPTAPFEKGKVKAKVLVCHGSGDDFVTPEQVQTFQSNLDAAGADWQMIVYGDAEHSFTNPDAGKAGMEQLVYDPAADRRSWRAMLAFFDEIFGE